MDFARFRSDFAMRNAALWAAYRRGEADLDALRVERFVGLGAPAARAAWTYERALGSRAVLFSDAREALRLLGRRFRLVLVTDGIAQVQYAKLSRTRLTGAFERIVISTEAGYRKPRPELLWTALAGTAPDSALVVGDSPVSDGAGARAAGIGFCWVHRGADTQPAVPVRYAVRNLGTLARILQRARTP